MDVYLFCMYSITLDNDPIKESDYFSIEIILFFQSERLFRMILLWVPQMIEIDLLFVTRKENPTVDFLIGFAVSYFS